MTDDKPAFPVVEYLIIYEDQDRPIEYFTEEKPAFARLEIVKYSWNCHLFKRLVSV